MDSRVGILYSAFDSLRSLVGELCDLLTRRDATPVRLIIEDLSGHTTAQAYPRVVLVLSNHPEAGRVASWLGSLGVGVVNAEFFSHASDRVSVRLRLNRKAIPTLPFAFASHPSVFTDPTLWDIYPAVLKSSAKEATWPVVSSIGELHDWVEAARARQFGWLIEQFVPSDVTIKWYFVGQECYAVNKRGRDDMIASVNEDPDVARLGWQISRAFSLEVGSVDIVRDTAGNLWPLDVNVVPAFRVWPGGYAVLANYLADQVAECRPTLV